MRPAPGRISGQDRQNFWQLPALHHYDDEIVGVVGVSAEMMCTRSMVVRR